MSKRKTVKERIIDRLKKGFGYDIPYDVEWRTHQATGHWVRSQGAWSWYFNDIRLPLNINDIGSSFSATTVLSWKRWVIMGDGEIMEYSENERKYYEAMSYDIEEVEEQ